MRSKNPIIPSVLAYTLVEFMEKLELARQVGNAVHLDLVEASAGVLASLPIAQWPTIDLAYVEAHIMAKDPLKPLDKLRQLGVTRAVIPIEAEVSFDELFERARELDLLLGFSVDIDTDLALLKRFYPTSSHIQIMGVPPGRGGQRQDPQAVLALRYLRRLHQRRLTLVVDGGVNQDNIKHLSDCGGDYFICGTSIFQGGNWQDNFSHLMHQLGTVVRRPTAVRTGSNDG